MTRQLYNHKVNDANNQLDITVLDKPGAGGAFHHYQITGFDTATNDSDPFVERYGTPGTHTTILFQNGPIPEKGVNGVTHEALLAIVADRLFCFQQGPYACEENAAALKAVVQAMDHLHSRTTKRMERGVEGTHEI